MNAFDKEFRKLIIGTSYKTEQEIKDFLDTHPTSWRYIKHLDLSEDIIKWFLRKHPEFLDHFL